MSLSVWCFSCLVPPGPCRPFICTGFSDFLGVGAADPPVITLLIFLSPCSCQDRHFARGRGLYERNKKLLYCYLLPAYRSSAVSSVYGVEVSSRHMNPFLSTVQIFSLLKLPSFILRLFSSVIRRDLGVASRIWTGELHY